MCCKLIRVWGVESAFMTYCVAVTVNRGLVFASDSRTNAGVDQLSTYSKMFTICVPGQRAFVVLTAGNLGTTQAVINRVRADIKKGAPTSLHTVESMSEAAEYVGEISLNRQHKTTGVSAGQLDTSASFILGGQIRDRNPKVMMIYPEGNFIVATRETQYLQIGEVKYGKPVLDRIITPETSLEEAALCAMVSMDSTLLERFKQEIRVARKVTHRNVVRTYDIGDTEGVKFISMEYVQGMTLKQLIRKRGALPVGVGLQIAKQASAGLKAAHQQGVVHRDVKPQNIILTPASEVKIMDFGIARPADKSGMTATGLIVGTPDYMSPEQVQGKKDLDHRSDIYSLGVVFYEMFTGVLPFSGDSHIAIAMKHVHEEPPNPRSINNTITLPLELIILRCMKKEPVERYQKVEDLQADLLEPSVWQS